MTEEDSWVFDGLVQFLRGPIWNVPILIFIENKSLIFYRDAPNEDEFHKIHEAYKNLVDYLLGTCLEDMNISPTLFESLCGRNSTNIKDSLHQSLFEQVWAADDYGIFKSMMIKKNLELTIQTMNMIKQISEGASSPTDTSNESNWSMDEQQLMEEVLKRSLEEYNAREKGAEEVEQELAKALEVSMEDQESVENERQIESDHFKKVMHNPDANTEISPTRTNEIDPEDLRKRQKYLRSQRDKLLKLKQEERLKIFKEYEQTEAISQRPKSCKAARTALNNSKIDSQTMIFRKALAEKLKQNVINK